MSSDVKDRRGKRHAEPGGKVEPNDEIERLRSDLATYKHAFETTTADRDRISQELESLKFAFDTTVADRDRIEAQFATAIDPLDAGNFRLFMRKYQLPENAPMADCLAQEWDDKFQSGAFKEVVDSVLENTPVRLALLLSEDSLRPIAAYMLASFHARRREFEQAIQYSEHFHYTASVDGADLLPYDIQQASRLSYYQQQRSAALNAPGAILVSLTRSASAFLSNAISQIFEVPVLRVSIGQGRRSAVITRWADQITDGGAITHEHFQAVPINLKALSDSGATKVWIQIRDPRDAAFSISKMDPLIKPYSVAGDGIDDETKKRQLGFVAETADLSTWIEQWLDAAASNTFDLDIAFLKYKDVTGDLIGTLQTMFPDHFDAAREQRAIELLNQFESGKIARRNFRKGTGQEWRTAFPQEVQDEAWNRIAGTVKDVLQLAP